MAYVPNAHPEGGRHATVTDVDFSIGSVKPFRGEVLISGPPSRPWRAEAHGGVDPLDAELACASVDASLRHCCAAVPHINANLRNISRCCHSVACSAASMLSLVNQSKRITRSIADLPQPSLTMSPSGL